MQAWPESQLSSADNQWAPLSHHLQDATHISYGMGTLGARWQMFQLEASLFNGREPDENRFNIDFGPRSPHPRRYSPQHSLSHPCYPSGRGPALQHGVWGMNQEFHGESRVLQSFGLESQYDWDQQRNHALKKITALTLGGIRELDWSEHFDLGLGADASLYFGDAEVRQTYGDMPYGFRVYLRLRPPTMMHPATAPAQTPTEPNGWTLPAEEGEHSH